ncbi:hypothetical protein Ancab_009972 [Ancistrocladus abbreviatus]
MISDPNQIRYACIAHNFTILAELNSADSSLKSLAYQCIQQSPPHHTYFSHTACKRTYSFLLDDLFVYFAIFDESVENSDQIWYLNNLKDALHELIRKRKSPSSLQNGHIVNSNDNLTPYCFQGELHPIFHQLTSKGVDFDGLNDSEKSMNGLNDDDDHDSRRMNSGGASSEGRRVLAVPLLTKVGEGLKKKKRFGFGESVGESKECLMEDKVDYHAEFTSREVCQREVGGGGGGLCLVDGGRQRAKKIWKIHVWIVLILDLAVCLILFGIWLRICHGFQCIDG